MQYRLQANSYEHGNDGKFHVTTDKFILHRIHGPFTWLIIYNNNTNSHVRLEM